LSKNGNKNFRVHTVLKIRVDSVSGNTGIFGGDMQFLKLVDRQNTLFYVNIALKKYKKLTLMGVPHDEHRLSGPRSVNLSVFV
jgi:hypothetical protein